MDARINLLLNLLKDSDLKRKYNNLSNTSHDQLNNLVDEVKLKASKLDTQLDHYKPELSIDELLDKNGCFNGVYFEGTALRRVANAVQIKRDQN